MREDDYNSIIDTMRQYKDDDEKPQIGIFWYSPEENSLVDVYVQDFDSVAPNTNGRPILTKIHQRVWEKNYYMARAKGDKKQAYYEQDYVLCARGRVNFNENQDVFEVMTGDWIDKYPDLNAGIIEDLQLPVEKTLFLKCEHWPLGHSRNKDL